MPDSNNPLTYHGYLRLDELLELQCPRGAEHTSGAELFFIVAHQVSELWLKSLNTELEALERSILADLPPSGLPMLHARRALAAAEMLLSSIEALGALDCNTFLGFRDYLGAASGMQSTQFARLRSLVGLGAPNGGPLELHLHARASDGEWQWVIDTLLEVSSTLWRWGVHHLDLTQRLIGERSGTGGTTGVRYLAERVLDRPFPMLWRARAMATS